MPCAVLLHTVEIGTLLSKACLLFNAKTLVDPVRGPDPNWHRLGALALFNIPFMTLEY
jgi:hypothetical protein